MPSPSGRKSPAAILAAIFLAALILVAGIVPGLGQQEQPGLTIVAPAVALPGRRTRVGLDFSLPRGWRLTRYPRVRTVDATGRLIELMPMAIHPERPGRAFQRLTTQSYQPGLYQVSGELDYQDGDGVTGTSASQSVTLTVPTPTTRALRR